MHAGCIIVQQVMDAYSDMHSTKTCVACLDHAVANLHWPCQTCTYLHAFGTLHARHYYMAKPGAAPETIVLRDDVRA